MKPIIKDKMMDFWKLLWLKIENGERTELYETFFVPFVDSLLKEQSNKNFLVDGHPVGGYGTYIYDKKRFY